MNLLMLLVSALMALAAAANTGSLQRPGVRTSSGVTAAPLPTPTPSPAPPASEDVINGGGPT